MVYTKYIRSPILGTSGSPGGTTANPRNMNVLISVAAIKREKKGFKMIYNASHLTINSSVPAQFSVIFIRTLHVCND